MDRTRVRQTAATRMATGPAADGQLRPDPDQRAVVEHDGGPLLVLGAAGTGKTTTVVEAAVGRVRDRGLDPRRVLVLTFSRGATRALAEQLAARLSDPVRTVPVFSVHGFCHALHAEAHRTDPWRVLTAPQQELRLREILQGSADDWGALTQAVGTRAFTREVRDLLARARQLGLDPVDLARLGRAAGRPAWGRAAALFEEYLDVLDAERVLDYDELVHRVRILLADPTTGDPLRARFDSVLVDDLQDAVPAHVALLRDLAPPGGGTELIALANPDHAAFAFRGVDPATIASFPADFADAAGHPAPVRVLRSDHRHGTTVARCVHAMTLSMPRPAALPDWRSPGPVGHRASVVGSDAQDRVSYVECGDTRDEALAVARALVCAHEEQAVPWHRMAVVVRSRGPAEAVLRRRLQRAGVPVAYADDTPLVDEPAVRVLLEVVSAALGGEPVPGEVHERLLLGPVGGVDPMDLRRHVRSVGAESEGLAGVRDGIAAVEGAVARTREALRNGGSAEEVLWAAWSATDWPARLREAALSGGPDADRADRDLDAVVALFDVAGRSGGRHGRAAAEELVEEVRRQTIAADSSTTRRLRRDAVDMVTALRCGGQEWEVVVVAGAQEDTWPARHRRRSLLAADQLAAEGEVPPQSAREALAEERRLFHLACARARRQLIITAVADEDGEGGRPSRFVSELGLVPTHFDPSVHAVPSAAGLVGELRAAGSDPAASPLLREHAAVALARLGEEIPWARPRHWWLVRARTSSQRPTSATDPIRLSGSSVDQLRSCPRKWFLENRAGGRSGATEQSIVGILVHRLAQSASRAELDLAGLRREFEAAWQAVPTGPPWRAEARRERVWSMVEAWWHWHRDRPDDQLVGVEVPFRCEVDVVAPDGRADRVLINGVVDRLELVDDSLVVVDYKTGLRPSAREVAQLGQLGVYQLAVRAGAFDEVTGGRTRRPGKALAVYLDAGKGTPAAKTLVQPSILDAPAPDEVDLGPAPDWVTAALGEAAAIVRDEQFAARRGPHCRGCRFSADCTTGEGWR